MNRIFNLRFIKNKTEYIFGIISFIAVVAVCVNIVKAGDMSGGPVLVSMGDSYSSGEGIEPFIDQDTEHKENCQNWMAHRSEKAWSGRLTLTKADGSCITMSDDKDNWYFVADSGAETWHISNSYDKPWNFGIGNSGKTHMDAQLDVFDKISSEGKTADFVTLTIGGNDAGFVNIIGEAATSYTCNAFIFPSHLSDSLENAWHEFYKTDGIRARIKKVYYEIADKAGEDAKIIVAGYPKLLSDNGGSFIPFATDFDRKETRMINNAVHGFNNELSRLVDSCRDPGNSGDKAINIYFVSVEESFDGHEAYSADPYINEIMPYPQPQEVEQDIKIRASSYSIHPNDKGAQVYADCVQKMIDSLMAQTPDAETDQEQEEMPAGDASDFDIIGTWTTIDGVDLTFYEDGTYEMDWGFGTPESGKYSTGDISGPSFPITMEGSSILSMMQQSYGGTHSNYHFEILVSNSDEIYLVQVYDDYTAETSPCKLYFSRR